MLAVTAEVLPTVQKLKFGKSQLLRSTVYSDYIVTGGPNRRAFGNYTLFRFRFFILFFSRAATEYCSAPVNLCTVYCKKGPGFSRPEMLGAEGR